MYATSYIEFSLEGFTNPSDDAVYDFTITTYFEDDTNTLIGIEEFEDMSIQATLGLCWIQDFYEANGDTRIYA